MATAGDSHPKRQRRSRDAPDAVNHDSPDGRDDERFYPLITLDFVTTLWSFGSGIAALVLTAILVVEYYHTDNTIEFYSTILTFGITALVCGIVSLQWSWCFDETSTRRKLFYTLAGFLKLGVLARYGEKLVSMIRGYRNKDYDMRRREREEDRSNDADFIGLFEGYVESAPQLLLQLYLMFISDSSLGIRDAVVILDFLTIPNSMTTSYMTNKEVDPDHQTLKPAGIKNVLGVITYTLWRVVELAPRLTLMALMFVYVGPIFSLAIVLHMAIMIGLNIVVFKPISENFCCHSSLLYVWSSYLGIYHFFNMQEDGKSSKNYSIVYYIIYYVENVTMASVVIGLTYGGVWEFMLWCYTAYSVIPGFFLHVFFVFLFYKYFHCPSVPKRKQKYDEETKIEETQSIMKTTDEEDEETETLEHHQIEDQINTDTEKDTPNNGTLQASEHNDNTYNKQTLNSEVTVGVEESEAEREADVDETPTLASS